MTDLADAFMAAFKAHDDRMVRRARNLTAGFNDLAASLTAAAGAGAEYAASLNLTEARRLLLDRAVRQETALRRPAPSLPEPFTPLVAVDEGDTVEVRVGPEPRMIRHLNKRQRAALAAGREEWSALALGTESADRPAVERAVARLYELAGQHPPRFVWCASPAGCALAFLALRWWLRTGSLEEPFWRSMRHRIGAGAWWLEPGEGAELAEALLAPLCDSFRGAADGLADLYRVHLRARRSLGRMGRMHGALTISVEWQGVTAMWNGADAFGGSVWPRLSSVDWGARPDDLRLESRAYAETYGSMREALWLPLVVELGRSAEAALADVFGGLRFAASPVGQGGALPMEMLAREAYRAAVADVIPRALLRAEPGELPRLWRAVLAGVSYLDPHVQVCFLAERPSVLSLDERRRLHRSGGPALAWRDGWAVWAWRGVRIHRRALERPQDLSAAEIPREGNVERRRVLLELYGAARFLQESGGWLVHADAAGELWRCQITGAGRAGSQVLAMVKVRNSTPEPDGGRREYWLRVPPDVETAREAVAWTFGKSQSRYRPEVEA